MTYYSYIRVTIAICIYLISFSVIGYVDGENLEYTAMQSLSFISDAAIIAAIQEFFYVNHKRKP
jgi:hypothetical protein